MGFLAILGRLSHNRDFWRKTKIYRIRNFQILSLNWFYKAKHTCNCNYGLEAIKCTCCCLLAFSNTTRVILKIFSRDFHMSWVFCATSASKNLKSVTIVTVMKFERLDSKCLWITKMRGPLQKAPKIRLALRWWERQLKEWKHPQEGVFKTTFSCPKHLLEGYSGSENKSQTWNPCWQPWGSAERGWRPTFVSWRRKCPLQEPIG